MTLRLIREPTIDGSTLGVLFKDGRFQCFTLEDPIRELAGQPVSAWKIPGDTAIPAGRYRVRLSWSPRFSRVLPELVDVPGFTGIRMHVGNRPKDTEGCLLVGLRRAGTEIRDSGEALAQLFGELEVAELAGRVSWIVIENPMRGV